MAQIQELKVEARDGTGKGPAFQARQKGLIPGVVYGGSGKPENVAVDGRTLERQIEKGHFLTTLVTLDVGGKKMRAIPREVQLDPVSDRPVHFNGQDVSPGIKKGGVLNIVRHSIGLICPADKIPHTIEVDVSKLDINETIHIKALTLPDGVKPIIRGRDFTVCS